MDVVLILLPFVLIGIAVLFIAFSGGAGAAREAYLTRGGRLFRFVVPILYIALGIGVPAAVIASREEASGGSGQLRDKQLKNAKLERGKTIFMQTCASCHSLAAVDARGITGPNLDQIGEVTPQRVLNAIRIGGTGQNRMPKGLLQGEDAKDVALYVSSVAGK
jgi:mono/diheme cytochrome c family protein